MNTGIGCHCLHLVIQSCPIICNPMDCSPPDPSVLEDSPGKNTGVGCHAFLQGIFPIQELNPGLLHCRWILYHLSHQGSPRILEWVAYPFFRGSSWPRNRIRVSCIAGRLFTSWATRETHYSAYLFLQNSWNTYIMAKAFLATSASDLQEIIFILWSLYFYIKKIFRLYKCNKLKSLTNYTLLCNL